jgi:uncharacterized protein
MRILIASAILMATLSASPSCQAQSEDRRQAAIVVTRLGTTQQINDTIASLRDHLVEGLVVSAPYLQRNAVIDAVDRIIMPEISAAVPSLIEEIADEYARTLSVEDLRNIAAFYDSPSGRRLVAALPQMAARIGPLSVSWAERTAAAAIDKQRDALISLGFRLPPRSSPR